ncbi:pyrroloquinoline quinone-dependent dehydrogenase [Parahaliea sp. F7430]|uniref:Pyrroloquinoline quinone-dependent dehydrogenase n=1 Tax=Sediminihaliea albiluteola TaxID=2758564 RepID=A0A7W2TUT0_9GAMM|nr:pyrroloquinoline quinone-dependent dehydrogenase [Sediminihaliea albiluteola]MBA6412362.1 pyrroloquinoline quinone-dependent dehydrogenase [Sediminihaliea albiluteola]
MRYKNLLKSCLAGLTLILVACGESAIDYSGNIGQWQYYGGNAGGQRFADLDQITADNVKDLEVAWVYHTGDVSSGNETHGATAFQATPLVAEGTMYVCTPYNRVIALDPETGEERWTYDPEVDLSGIYTPTCRGVAYWQGEEQGTCSSRIVSGTLDARLINIDAKTGKACSDFGDQGSVNLLNNLGDVRPGEYYVTSAPLVINDLVITGAFVKDGQRVDAPSGVVRAYDIRSGQLRWAYDPVPPGMTTITAEQAEQGALFTRSTPNTWGNISADIERGIVYLPTGGSQPDHYAGDERGDMDYYGTSVIAVDANTGERIWNFQTVHHDIWDWDVAAQPVTFEQHGTTPGVIAATKMGHIFLLNRETGEPLFPVEERAVPQSRVPGEFSAPTQPFPTLPKPVHPNKLTEDDIWGIYPGDKAACLKQFREFTYEGIFTPPDIERPALLWPGLGGGINWGSVSVNPHTNIMLVNSMRVPYTVQILPRAAAESLDGSDLVGVNPQEGTPYVVQRGGFLSPNNTPCTPPPWGVLTAINLDSGETLWEQALGNLAELAPLGLGKFFNWGTPNTGGSLQTASGLVFIAATLDGYIRAFDSASGKLLWDSKLPAPAQATPISYRLSPEGKQYIAIAAGGHGPLAYAAKGPEKLGELLGDAIVVYALP